MEHDVKLMQNVLGTVETMLLKKIERRGDPEGPSITEARSALASVRRVVDQLDGSVARTVEATVSESCPTLRLHQTIQVEQAPRKAPVLAAVDEDAPSSRRPAYFEPGEPTRFKEYVGQTKVMNYLTHAVRGLDASELAIRPVFFIGPPGLGKTTIAKVTAFELQIRAVKLQLPLPDYIEVTPVEIPNVMELDKIMRRAQRRPGSIVFIDEVHALVGKEHFLKLYQALINGQYRFEGERHPTKLPPTTFLAATTDYGRLPEAFMSRFAVQQLLPARPSDLLHMVLKRPFKVSRPAAEMIVDRAGRTGVPREVLELYHEGVVFAKGSGKDFVGLPEVKEACDNQGIDKYGLRARDRAVIEMLFRFPRLRKLRNGGEEFTGFVQSEKTIFTVTQIDPEYYQKNIEPRLISRGFLEIRTNGRALTKHAEVCYRHLVPPQYQQFADGAVSTTTGDVARAQPVSL